jgi:protein-S-isoprenylcysteine O-methyltransferase Ste14
METALEWLFACLWWGWFGYWMISARGVKSARRRESLASLAAHGVPLVVAVYLLAAPQLPAGWLTRHFMPPTLIGYLAGAGTTVVGLGLTVWARRTLGTNWSAAVTVKQDHQLVVAGPYRYVRHPIYSGLLLAFAGSALARAEWRGVLAVLIALCGFWLKWRLEERWMRETFGPAYSDYAVRTPAIVPQLF